MSSQSKSIISECMMHEIICNLLCNSFQVHPWLLDDTKLGLLIVWYHTGDKPWHRSVFTSVSSTFVISHQTHTNIFIDETHSEMPTNMPRPGCLGIDMSSRCRRHFSQWERAVLFTWWMTLITHRVYFVWSHCVSFIIFKEIRFSWMIYLVRFNPSHDFEEITSRIAWCHLPIWFCWMETSCGTSTGHSKDWCNIILAHV